MVINAQNERFKWLESHASNTYSQHGEDGVLAALFDRIGVTNRYCVDVGANDGTFCSNVRRLIERGWQGLLIEPASREFERLEELYRGRQGVRCLRRAAGWEGEDALDAILEECGAPEDPDLLILDVDGPDYYIWNGLLRHRPRVLLVEFSARQVPDHVPTTESALAGQQATFGALLRLGGTKAYIPVLQIGCNLLFVRKEDIDRLPEASPALPAGPIRLNLGDGGALLPGYVNLDGARGDIIYPLTDYPDGSVEEIRASHVLEHFGHQVAPRVLREWLRVLRPGGLMKLAVPDFRYCLDGYLSGSNENFQGYLMGGQVDERDYHRCLFDEGALRAAMKTAGLMGIRPWQSEIQDCASLPVSLNLMGRKPMDVRGVFAAMSVPRFGPTATHNYITSSLFKLGIRIEQVGGAYWGKCLAKALGNHLDARYLLTVDHDTVCTWEEIAELYRLMEENPAVDAVCALQVKRENEGPIFTVLGQDGTVKMQFGAEIRQDLMPIASGHFGLTMLRSSALQHMPHPWFSRPPAPRDEKWDDDTVDDDIAFWRTWAACHYTLCLAPHVVIGHMQEMISWPKDDMTAVHQYVGDYGRNGKPAGTWE